MHKGVVMQLSYEEKLDLMKHLNWDYLDTYEDMLAVIEGKMESSGALNREKLLARSMERLRWYPFIRLWGVENFLELYTPKVRKMIWHDEIRRRYDYAASLLRGETISTPGWGTKYFESDRFRFFSHRRDSPE
jgi:hypothetical protein